MDTSSRMVSLLELLVNDIEPVISKFPQTSLPLGLKQRKSKLSLACDIPGAEGSNKCTSFFSNLGCPLYFFPAMNHFFQWSHP
uniref:Uncharacterized protein n=1 Tax=Arion vulgaris TaxID=1028688 RepID=A0A0B6Z1C5_9EUPU